MASSLSTSVGKQSFRAGSWEPGTDGPVRPLTEEPGHGSPPVKRALLAEGSSHLPRRTCNPGSWAGALTPCLTTGPTADSAGVESRELSGAARGGQGFVGSGPLGQVFLEAQELLLCPQHVCGPLLILFMPQAGGLGIKTGRLGLRMPLGAPWTPPSSAQTPGCLVPSCIPNQMPLFRHWPRMLLQQHSYHGSDDRPGPGRGSCSGYRKLHAKSQGLTRRDSALAGGHGDSIGCSSRAS